MTKRILILAAFVVLGVVSGWPEMGRSDSLPASQPAVLPAGTPAAIVELSGEIDDYNESSFTRRFDEAKAAGAKVIIVDLESYGGLVTSGLDISRFLKRQTDVHTIAYVKDRAISAGAMIAMACDQIVMSSSATLGDCAPIVFGPDNQLENMSPAERAKAESPVLLDFEESAQRNHHDVLLAKAMVAVEISVYWVQSPTGQRKFVDADEYKQLIKQGWKDVPGAPLPVVSSTNLLTVDSEEAFMYGLATGPVSSAEALAQQHGWPVTEYRVGEGDQIVEMLGTWPVRLMLLIIFLSCANVVLHAPGHGVAEVIGLAALLLMLGVPLLTGYAQWWQILMIFVGLGLVAFEILLPGHLLPGLTGAFLVIVGLVLTFVHEPPSQAPGLMPAVGVTWPGVAHALEVVVGGMACAMVIWIIMNRFLPK
ncbi:MAG TPA: hypothetical protein VMD30_00265, partial [Tepidisphaeraceae bacterium]|nr:hypothetical protein [Tepidisphaeraceae bacterium]